MADFSSLICVRWLFETNSSAKMDSTLDCRGLAIERQRLPSASVSWAWSDRGRCLNDQP